MPSNELSCIALGIRTTFADHWFRKEIVDRWKAKTQNFFFKASEVVWVKDDGSLDYHLVAVKWKMEVDWSNACFGLRTFGLNQWGKDDGRTKEEKSRVTSGFVAFRTWWMGDGPSGLCF